MTHSFGPIGWEVGSARVTYEAGPVPLPNCAAVHAIPLPGSHLPGNIAGVSREDVCTKAK